MNRRTFVTAAAAAAACGLGAMRPSFAAKPVPAGGPIRLTDHTGRRIDTSVDFAGRPMLIYFGYTFCPDICPTTLQTLTMAVDVALERNPAAKDLAFLFVTFDPERDDVARMAEYVANFHPMLVGLTGTEEEIEAVAKDWKAPRYIPEHEPGEDYAVHHPANSWLSDRQHRSAKRPWFTTPPEDVAAEILGML